MQFAHDYLTSVGMTFQLDPQDPGRQGLCFRHFPLKDRPSTMHLIATLNSNELDMA